MLEICILPSREYNETSKSLWKIELKDDFILVQKFWYPA